MSLHSVSLKELTHPVPIGSGSMSLSAVLQLLSQSGRDRLVVVNEQQHPTGLVRLSQVLPLVLNVAALEERFSALGFSAADHLHAPLQQAHPAVIELVLTVPDSSTLQQLVASLVANLQVANLQVANLQRANSSNSALPTYAVVDPDGVFVGLLDCDRLLHHLAESLTESSTPAAPQQQIIQLTQQLLAQRAELEQRIKTQQAEITALRQEQASAIDQGQPTYLFGSCALPSNLTLFTLLQLLERLPLPLMLQTNTGEVLAQNSVWRKQVGELSDPVAIWREAAVWLSIQTQIELDDRSSGLGVIDSFANQRSADSTASEQSLCQIGSSPDTCVCVCPLRDGQEQVLQFAKISLASLLPDLNLDWSQSTAVPPSPPAASIGSTLAEAIPFQLATLTLDVDANTFASATDSPHLTTARTTATATAQPVPPAIESLWLVLAQDVTKQQHLARELTAKNADLVQLNRLKDEFLACISHELKTPLTAVLGLSSLLKDQTLGELNQRQVRYAQLIHQSSRHLMAVVNDILDLTRIETGQLELLYEPVHIATVCSRAFEQAKQTRLIESKTQDPLEEELIGSQFSLEIEPGLELLVADDLRLRQMLVHLLANSLKFTQLTDPIGLKVSHWGGWIAFTVWDTGIGIAAEQQHLIFQKFQQLENPLTRQFDGAGLGLVLTRRLARLHGGDVTFTSKEGQGSQFTILLPPRPPDKTQTYPTSPHPADGSEWMGAYPSGRGSLPVETAGTSATSGAAAIAAPQRHRLMLLVDAVPQYVEALTNQITGLGYRVAIARSGTEALEKARRLQPDMIFLNPLLPLLSGWDVLTLLKSNRETQHLPVVITAAGPDEEQAYRHQANGFLRLPVQSRDLERSLQRLMPKAEPERQTPGSNLTILRLSTTNRANPTAIAAHLDHLLQSQQYRILESDDLEQAALLAQVWQPDVILLDSAIAHPADYLHQLSQHKCLAALPLVTLTQAMTQAANQLPGLLVFPCLAELGATEATDSPETLFQVIHVAARYVWKPFILAVDVSSVPMLVDGTQCDRPDQTLGKLPQATEWLQALTQYLHTAGLRGAIGRSWQEVLHQIDAQAVDLLLLCWTNGEPSPDVMRMLAQLHQLNPKPPIVVLDHRDPELDETTLIPLPAQVRQLTAQILSPPVSMPELLDQINWAIRHEGGG